MNKTRVKVERTNNWFRRYHWIVEEEHDSILGWLVTTWPGSNELVQGWTFFHDSAVQHGCNIMYVYRKLQDKPTTAKVEYYYQ